MSFENARVTCGRMVMVSSNDRTTEVSVGRDIDPALVRQDASVIVPVRKA